MKSTLASLSAVALFTAAAFSPIFASSESEIGTSSETTEIQGSPRAVVLGDFNADGLSDVYAINPYGEDRLYRNAGDGSFLDVTGEVGLSGLSATRQVLFADYDGDGLDDLLVVNASATRLFRNLGDLFIDDTLRSGLTTFGLAHDAKWEDIEGDGFLDLVLYTSEGVELFRGLGRGMFERVKVTVPGPPASGDVSSEGLGTGTTSGGTSALSAGITWTATGAGSQAATTGTLACAGSVEDQSNPGTGSCIPASTTPTLGHLYPLGSEFSIDGAGQIVVNGIAVIDNTGEWIGSPTGLVGPQGPAGADGAQGDTGPQGDQGDTGPAGADGADGAAGPAGADGAQGDTGPAGADGTDGTDGSAGPAGPTGPAGAQGPQGNAGNTGPVGPIGPAGPAGPTGPSGTSSWTDGTGYVATTSGVKIGAIGSPTVGSFHVLGDATMASAMISPNAGVNASAELWLGESSSGHYRMGWRYDGAVNQMHLMSYSDGAELGPHLAIERTDGRLGVGTTSPNATLTAKLISGSGSIIRGDIEGVDPDDDSDDVTVFRVTSTGRTITTAVEITGGGDLVEGFESSEGKLEPGTVVVIDAERAGQLKSSSSAYDRKVAGVISGAGGINHGIQMGQDGVMDGENLVAMTGRIYVKCSAENGAIQPGDLLTTADIVGHAMRAEDVNRSFGAVIGKAMTSLEDGTGLVLVLVNLQ